MLGAEQFLDYTQEDVSEAVNGVDVAFDTVGGETTQTLLRTVREGGVLVTIANALPDRSKIGQQASERGVRAELVVMSPRSEQLARIAELVGAGEVRVEIAQTFPLAEAQQAHVLSESGHTRGKLILVP
jgi:NADPH:quinone reductase-like Zn-dependent oxidoreductase